MRFKQALSRKLAAALSAVMILSTIAPTSVPVLAAAPDDVLVDSNVEYDLQDAGSEDVLLDSAESSLAEETDTLEVAGEELLAPETASDEVLVDSAEEVLSEETGIEPVEGVETPETDGESGLTVNFTSSNIIESIKYSYFEDATTESSELKDFVINALSGDSVRIVSQPNTVGIKISEIKVVEDYEDESGTFKVTVSGNDYPGVEYSGTTNTSQVVDMTTPSNLTDQMWTFDKGAVDVAAEKTAFTGRLHLNVISENIITKVGVISEDKAQPQVNEDYTDFSKEIVISYNKATKVKVTIPSSDGTIAIDTDVYKLSGNKVQVGPITDPIDKGTPYVIDVKADGDIYANVGAVINSTYKSGTLHIDVLSQNTVKENNTTDKIISINKIKVQFGHYNKGDGLEGDEVYDVTTQNGIDLKYQFAKDVFITVFEDDGYTTAGKYEYKIGNQQKLKDAQSDAIDLAAAETNISIRPVQVKFDSNLNIDITSNNEISSFKVQFYSDETGTTPISGSETTVPVSFNGTKVVAYKDAKSVRFSEFKKGGAAVDLNKTVLKLNDKVSNDSGDDVLFKLGKEGTTVKLETIAKKKVTVSVDDITKLDGISTLYYKLDGDEVKSSGTNGEAAFASKIAEVYVEPGRLLSINVVLPTNNYYFPEASVSGKKIDVSRLYDSDDNLTDEVWTIGKVDADTQVDIASKSYLADSKDKESKVTVTLEGSGSGTKLEGLEFTGAVASVPTISSSKVFAHDGTTIATGTPLTVTMTVSMGDLAAHYDITKVTYTDAEGKTKTITGSYISKSNPEDISDRNLETTYETFAVEIPSIDVRAGLMKNGTFDIKATQEKVDKYYNVYAKTDSGVKSVSVVYGDEIATAGSGETKSINDYFDTDKKKKAHYVKYGDKVSFEIELKPGFALKNAEVSDLALTTAATPGKLIVSENKVKFEVATQRGAFANITTEEAYVEKVQYKNNDKVEQDTNKNYLVIYNKPVSLALLKGTGSTSQNIVAKIGNKDVTSDLISKGVLKAVSSGSIVIGYEFNGDNDVARGKKITLTLFPGGTSATDKNAKTVVFIVDAANKSFKFAKSEETMPVGGTAKFTPTVKGTIETELVVNGAAVGGKKYTATGITIELSDDNKTLTVTSTAALGGEKEFKVTVKDVNAKEELSTVTIKLTFDALKAAQPSGQITNKTNNSITVGGLTPGKIDKNVDGLYYYYKATRTDSKGGDLLRSSVDGYVTVSDNQFFTIDLLKPGATDAEKLAGIEGATYDVVITVVQRNGSSSLSGAVSKEFKPKTVEMKAGGIFETKLGLKKISKGNPYTNMSAADELPFQIQPVYSKNTSIQKLEKVEVWSKDGTTLYDTALPTGALTATGLLKVSDTMIEFYPKGLLINLPAGNYTIKAYAMEYTGVDVVAKLNLKVAQAIETLELRNQPKKIVTTGKKTTATLTAYDMTGNALTNKNYNKKTNKVNWYLVTTASTNPKDAKEFTYTGVSIKNGKITVAKGIKVTKDITFKVLAIAKDYAGNTTFAITPNPIVLTSQCPILNMRFRDPATYTYKDIGSSYLVKDFFTKGSLESYEYYARVYVYDKDTANQETTVPADFKVSGAKLIYTRTLAGTTYAYIGLTKPGKIKITATATDGSARKCVKEVTVGYTTDYALEYELYRSTSDYTVISTNEAAKGVNGVKAGTVDNYLPAGESLPLYIHGAKYDKDAGNNVKSLINHKVTVKGGKLAKTLKNGIDRYTITPNAEQTIVTIVDNTTRNKDKLTITINNKAIGSKKLTAAKVTAYNMVDGKDAKGKIFSHINYNGAANYDKVSVNMVKYTLTASSKSASLSADYAIINVIKDDEKGGTNGIVGALNHNNVVANNPKNTIDAVGDGTYAVKLDSSKSFYVNWAWANDYAHSAYGITPGSYKITVTPAKQVKVDGVNRYEATGKAVNVTVSAKKAPKANVKPVAKLDFTGSNKAKLLPGTPKNVVKDSVALGMANPTADPVTGKVAPALKNANNKGVLNHFATYFKLSDDKKELVFQGSPAYKDVDGKDVPAVDSIDAKDKAELQGWIAYKYQTLDGTVVYDYYKVTLNAKNGIKK